MIRARQCGMVPVDNTVSTDTVRHSGSIPDIATQVMQFKTEGIEMNELSEISRICHEHGYDFTIAMNTYFRDGKPWNVAHLYGRDHH